MMITFDSLREYNIANGFSPRSRNGRAFRKWKHIGSFDMNFLETLIAEARSSNKDELLHIFLTKKGRLAPVLIRGKRNYYLAPIEKGMKKQKSISVHEWLEARKVRREK